jgi:GT2 family glycosyltransferase
MKVAAGIIHYRFWPGVAVTIDALMSQTRPPDELFVYDHASGDDSAERIRERYPGVEVIEAPENRGPIPGANAVLRELTSRDADAVLVLTQNSRLAPDALERMAERLEEAPEVGAVGPLIGYSNAPDLVFFGGGYIDPRTWDIKFNASRPRMSDWMAFPLARSTGWSSPGS